MKASPLHHLHAQLRRDPCVIEPTDPVVTCNQGPELLLVMVALLAIGMGLGAVSAITGVALLAGGTGIILACSPREVGASADTTPGL